LCEPWFHGFLTHRETELLLEKEEIGTFLVRFSESRPGAFTLAFVHKHPDKGKQVRLSLSLSLSNLFLFRFFKFMYKIILMMTKAIDSR